MKKTILSLTMGAALLIAPMTASALTPMTSDSLKDATGQAGVSIALDNILLYQSVGATTYTDTDGYYDMDAKAGMGGEAEGKAASIVIGGKEKVTTIFAILDNTNRGGKLARSYGSASLLTNGDALGAVVGIDQGDIRPLNIDVASRVQLLSDGMMYNASGIAVADQMTRVVAAKTADAGAIEASIKTAYVTAAVTDGSMDQTAWIAANPTITDPDEIAAGYGAYLATEFMTADAWAEEDSTTENTDTPLAGDFYSNSMAIAKTAEDSGTDISHLYYAKTQVAGVVIGLPTVEICTTADSYDVGIASEGSHNDGKKFIHISKGKSVMAILGGTLEIAAH